MIIDKLVFAFHNLMLYLITKPVIMKVFLSLIVAFIILTFSCKKKSEEKSLMNTLADGISYWKVSELQVNGSTLTSNFSDLKITFGLIGWMRFVKEINPSGLDEGLLYFSINTNAAGKQIFTITDNPLAPQYLKDCLGEWIVLSYTPTLVSMTGVSNNANSLILRKK